MDCNLHFNIPAVAICAICIGLSLACGEITTPVNPIAGEIGGEAGTTGAAGTPGGAGMVTTGGAESMFDGGSMLDASGVAGNGQSGSSGGTGSISGCPEPAPVAAKPDQTIAIQSIHFARSEVVLRNISQTQQTLAGGRTGWQWCNIPDYWNIKLTEGNIVLGPGDTYKFRLVREDGQPRPLYPGDDPAEINELGIYNTTGSFMTPELIEAFVSWGEGSGFGSRENVAGMAFLWSFGSRIAIAPGDAGFIATGNVVSGAGFTSVPERCLPADP